MSDQTKQEVLHYINNHPELLSVLFDVDLLPEQTMKDPRQWLRTLLVVHLFQRIGELEAKVLAMDGGPATGQPHRVV